MKCKNCGKDIDESEVFCDDCKNHLREVSSRENVTELEQLIENQDKFQELDNLKDLKENTESSETEIPMNLKREDINKDVATKKPLNKKLIIIIIVSIIVVLSIVVSIIIFLPHEKPKNNVDTVDYKQVINEYGKSIEKNISIIYGRK